MSLSTSKLEGLSLDELSVLFETVRQLLAEKIELEKRRLEQQLAKLNGEVAKATPLADRLKHRIKPAGRKKYPAVQPKYQNPVNLSETWAGRGKRPRWMVAQLTAGKKVEDFLIKANSEAKRVPRS